VFSKVFGMGTLALQDSITCVFQNGNPKLVSEWDPKTYFQVPKLVRANRKKWLYRKKNIAFIK